MNNFATRNQRSSNSRPPVFNSINKNTSYARSPSVSRIGINGITTNGSSSSNYYSNSNYTRPSYNKTNGSAQLPNQSYQSNLMRKTGSCQNLISPDNQIITNGYSTLRNKNEPQPTIVLNNTRAYGSNSSATNNSFSRPNQHSPSNGSFYNGYKTSYKPTQTSSIYNQNSKSIPPSNLLNKQGYISTSSSSNKYSHQDNQHLSCDSSSDSAELSHNDNYYNNSRTNGHVSSSNGTTTTASSNHYSSSSLGGDYQRNNGVTSNSSSYLKNGYINQNSETTKSLNNSYSNKGLVGLANLGNTCFMNSVLQCLSNCKPLHEFFLSNRFEREINENSKTRGALIKSFGELIKSMWTKEPESYVSPDKFKRHFQKIAPSFHGTAQQDSQEFLRLMLEALHQDVNRVKVRPKPLKINEEEDEKLPDNKLAEVYWNRYLRVDNSFIVDVFVGQLKSTLMCRTCGYKSITFDPFWDLSLPIPKSRSNNTLNQCLELFTSEEILEGDEMPKCGRCKQKRSCTKSFSIQKFPQILVIHLKRFSGDRYRSKISSFIEFPTNNLDLSKFTASTCQQNNVTYNLYGVSNHSGTVHGGHYTAYCCNPISNNWYEFNDTRVHRVSESSVCSSEAYVLFYERN